MVFVLLLMARATLKFARELCGSYLHAACLRSKSARFHRLQMPFLVVFSQRTSKAFLPMCFKYWAPRRRMKISQAFEGGQAGLSPKSDPLPTQDPAHSRREKQAAGRGELGVHSWDLLATPHTVDAVLAGCYLCLPCQTLEGRGPQRIYCTDMEMAAGAISP